MAWEQYQDDAEACRCLVWVKPWPIVFKMGGPFFAPLQASKEQERERELESRKVSTLVLPDTSKSSICKSHGHLVYAVESLYPPTSNSTSNANNLHSHNPNLASQQDGNESDGALPESETEEEMAAVKKAKDDADLGPNPATRMNMGWSPCKIACRMRVGDVCQRYTPSLICLLIAQETDNYFSLHGLPHLDVLLFMDKYYNWELESVSKGDRSVDGSGEDGEGESFELEQQQQQVAGAGHENSSGEGSSKIDMDLGSSMGGVISSFYITSLPVHLLQSRPGPFTQMPLPLLPPPLASMRMPALWHLFMDIPTAPAAGHARETAAAPKAVPANTDYDNEESGVGGGSTSGGVVPGLPSASTPSSTGSLSSGGLMVGGVKMGIGMFSMAMGAMGLGWFGSSPSLPTPVPVAVGDIGGVSVGDRKRKHESSLSYALGV
ncbi:hypothetical protein DFH08DRAFT_998540 [Mycena albidolilacea]|uniref:Uncharacterized protein n=1 Tax=Mycena albidolilacea TaxID=1033008 RepID=A0AAD7A404_9AGAR|nr:hypothetical protein DFH08DRAFT_998540 [Mycena albidolilacea]